jgi:solute carrier family 25 carnitine/acylcarnitine transporter 20/29
MHVNDRAGSLLYFSTYEYLKVQFTPKGEKRPDMAGTLMAGGVAGIMNWVAALPIDVLKTRLQVAPEGL